MSYLTDGAWSPNRPGLFLTSKMDGSIDVWDYLLKQNEPSLSVQVLVYRQNQTLLFSSVYSCC